MDRHGAIKTGFSDGNKSSSRTRSTPLLPIVKVPAAFWGSKCGVGVRRSSCFGDGGDWRKVSNLSWSSFSSRGVASGMSIFSMSGGGVSAALEGGAEAGIVIALPLNGVLCWELAPVGFCGVRWSRL